MSYTPLKSLLQLQPGTVLRMKTAKFGAEVETLNFIVTGNYGKFVTVVSQGVVTDIHKWEIWTPGGNAEKSGRYI